MTHDQIFGLTLLSLVASAILSRALTRWREAKGRTSIHAADQSTDDIAISALASLGSEAAKFRRDGTIEMRPPIGARIIVPIIGAILLLGVDLAPLFQSFGASSPGMLFWSKAGTLAALAVFTLHTNISQRVVYSDRWITCRGVQLTAQTRKLSDLVDIAVHPKRHALVLTFAEQKRMYVPKFLTGREAFVLHMRMIIEANLARGKTVPEPDPLARVGF